MNRHLYIMTLTVMAILLLALPLNAQEHDHSGQDHGAMQGHAEHEMPAMTEHSGRSGKLIHESAVDGFKLAYHLIDMRAAMSEMEGHGGHTQESATHHLMVYITGPQGDPMIGATVGFLIEGPNGADQKIMAMGMGGGYGADVYLGGKGTYTIKTKAALGDTTLIDGFEYNVPE